MSIENKIIDVLDKGYVRLVDKMGSDLSVVNAARASFAKESHEFSKNDARLIDFLARENHMSPFRHAFVTLEIKAPLMVARQHGSTLLDQIILWILGTNLQEDM